MAAASDGRGLAALRRLTGGLVVSCQARQDNPLHGPQMMGAMAVAAINGGAVGIRADGPVDIAAIRAATGPDVPIIGIAKAEQPDGSLFITPSIESALQVIAAGAELVALDGTPRPRPGGDQLDRIVAAIHEAGGVALADVGTEEHARYAIQCGADAVGTTLSGYTPDSPTQDGPDFDLISRLVSFSPVPIFAEGRFWSGEEARTAIGLGAAFVVVGTAITNPQAITARFVGALSAPTR
ncbi:MAG TPA: N-acetylmannosamine-6-phosphate 2-epimerase [Thermomicrobiales bacterium]|nr:N-acetylmannosamine-6-phosphate 2-epimerase [Thermomicrobiales bacterium]